MAMEPKHKDRLKADFTRLLAHKKLYVLDIPDDYKYMDPTLVEHLEYAVPTVLNLMTNRDIM